MAADYESYMKSISKLVGEWGKDVEKLNKRFEDLYKERTAIAGDYDLSIDDLFKEVKKLEVPDDANASDAKLVADLVSKKAETLKKWITSDVLAKLDGRPKALLLDIGWRFVPLDK
jgi:hypothetical protein